MTSAPKRPGAKPRASGSANEVEQARQFIAAVVESLPGIFYVVSADGRILRWNRRLEEVTGYTPAQIATMSPPDFFVPEDRPLILQRITETLTHGQAFADATVLASDGRRIPYFLSGSRAVTEDGPCIIGMGIDATGRKTAEDALRQSEADYRGLVEHAPLGIYRSTPDGRFLHVNPALVAMLGYASAEEVLHLDMARDVYADPLARSTLIPQFAHQDVAKTETEWRRKDGRPVTVRLSVRIVHGPSGGIEYFEGLAEDITQQRSLENQVRQAQRLEAVGRLAGGVSHDFNNVLTAITGFSDLLLEDLAPGDPKRRDVEEIRAAATRAAALTRQLLAFSRKQVLQPRVMSANELITGLHRVLQRLIGEDVTLEISLDPALGAVRADPGQLEQVILNLAVNARDAMPDGGRLTIETRNVELDETYARDHPPTTPGRCVLLAVSDTGVGMDAEVRSHLFEPFFTTKQQGKGTGLGLATVYGIVKQSGGHVWAYSEPGHGATFKVYLPRVEESVEAPAQVPAAVPAAGGRETVLLAEDDPGVREVASDALEHKGYRLLRAPDGQTALEMAAAHAGTIHALVTDIVMPGMTGRELAEALAALRPGIKILYMSGYTDDAVVRHGVLEDGLPYLQKPFTPEALARKVREVLDRT